jgi:hypothetical protein
MSGAAFLRVVKLKGSGIVTVAARHNKREIQAEIGAAGSIDPVRSNLNYRLAGPPTAEAVAQLAKDLMCAAGVVKLRKDAVRGIETVFSLPVGTALDTRAYFAACLEWAAVYFGDMANILSFDVHLDEAAPHAHALVLPLVNGLMNGGRMFGARSKMLDMHSQFHQAVAKRYGLRKAPAKLKGDAKNRAAAQVMAYMRETGDTSLQSRAWPNIRACMEADPLPSLLALGLVTEPAKPVRPFVDYVTSTGKGPRREREQLRAKSIDIETANFGKGEVYVSGDFAKTPVLKTPPPAPAPATINEQDTDERNRLRDGCQPGNSSTQQDSTSGNIATRPVVQAPVTGNIATAPEVPTSPTGNIATPEDKPQAKATGNIATDTDKALCSREWQNLPASPGIGVSSSGK